MHGFFLVLLWSSILLGSSTFEIKTKCLEEEDGQWEVYANYSCCPVWSCVRLKEYFSLSISQISHLGQCVEAGMFDCGSRIVSALAESSVDSSLIEEEFLRASRKVKKGLSQVASALERSKPVKHISPAFEWAQSTDEIFVSIKFSHKLDAPATLDVAMDSVDLTATGLRLEASKDRKLFVLNLAFEGAIDPAQSTAAPASVGRYLITAKKLERAKWPRLLKEGQRPANMHVWWAKQEQYTDELDDLEEELASAKAAGDGKMAEEVISEPEPEPLEEEEEDVKAAEVKALREARKRERKAELKVLEDEYKELQAARKARAQAEKRELEEELEEKRDAIKAKWRKRESEEDAKKGNEGEL
ncbi:unnamed protein product [Chrysoparadoxa australica]